MKIVQIITRMDVLGGAQIHVVDLAKGLVQNGHDVTILSYGTGDLTRQLYKDGITYIEIKHLSVPISPFKDLFAVTKIRKILKELNPDLVATHSSKAGILGRIAAYTLKIPTIFTAHSWSFTGISNNFKRQLYILIERQIACYTNGVITVSQYDYDAALLHKVMNPTYMKVIHNGLPDLPRRNNIHHLFEPTVPQLLMVARFAEPKDHYLLLNALHSLKDESFYLTLVGDGPLITSVKEYAKKLRLDHLITFTGETISVQKYYDEADICLLISRSEGLPLSIVEAMRARVAVIGSNVGGMQELISNNVNGFLVSKDNKEELVKAIRKLLHNSKLRQQFANASRIKYVQQYQFSKMIKETESFYQQIIKKENRREEAI